MEIAQIILEVILVFIGLYLALFKSYFQEKGKNIATKEDIQEITELVETVKNQIHFSTQSKLSLKTEERNALVNHYEKYNYWLNTILDTYLGGINKENIGKLKDFEQRLNDAKFNFELADGRKEIFVDNKEIDELLKELKIKTLELQHIVEKKFGELEYWFFEVESMRKSTPLVNEQAAKYKELLEKKSNILKEMNAEKLERFIEIAPKDKKFQILVFNHLQKIIKEE
ncbi:hypothetical protein [Aquirufa nivalisilvae]